MRTLSTRFLARGAVATAVALTATGLASIAPAANATSGSLSYSCSNPSLGTNPFTAVIDTDAPATLGAGLSAPIKTTSTVTAPEAIVTALRTAGISYVSGSANATGTVDGVNRQTTLTIPNTPVPPAPATTMQVVGSGPSGNITAGAVGSTILLGAGNFTATLQGYNSAGSTVGTPYTFTCTLQPPTQDLLVDSVAVVPTPTTTTLTITPSPLEYGAAPDVTADVAVTGTNAKPAGTVEFTFEGKAVKVDVKGGKAKATLTQALTMGSRKVTATFTPTDPTIAGSGANKFVSVVRDQTTTTATAVYRDARNRMVGKAVVDAVHGTEVTGNVKFILKRNGTKIREAVVELNQFDKAKRVFKHISKPGKYKLVAKYLGSNTLKRSKGTDTVVV